MVSSQDSFDLPLTVGISVGHHEFFSPTNEHCSLFFQLLRVENRRTEPLVELTNEHLASVGALLLGEPHQFLNVDEVNAIRDWVKSGGRLLLLHAMGGDARPYSNPEHQTNLNEIVPDLFSETYVANNQGSTIHIDVSKLLRRDAVLRYHAGCGLDDKDAILESDDLVYGQEEDEAAFMMYDWDISVDGVLRSDSGNYIEDIGVGFLSESKMGRGRVIAFGAGRSFADGMLEQADNQAFLQWLFQFWLPGLTGDELATRMKRPQRHRLLQGYPMAPAMRVIEESEREQVLKIEPVQRDAIIGVLPHPFCNPKVAGCGFCTFPNELFNGKRAAEVVAQVRKEIVDSVSRDPSLADRNIKALYFGGGTANLTPAPAFEELCATLDSAFDLANAEITLEGVPSYFIKRHPSLVEIIQENLRFDHLRISMGIQSFDSAELQRMGRQGYGDAATFSQVAHWARKKEIDASCDLLINLPSQSLEQMEADICRAIDAGFTQICVYHLVLFEGLGTEWSRDEKMLGELHSNEESLENWQRVRELLINNGYTQTTLTNFERREQSFSDAGFCYELHGYTPEQNDLIGFGPSGISLFSAADFQSAIKWRNPEYAGEYVAHSNEWSPPAKQVFHFEKRDMQLLYLTRAIAKLGFAPGNYRSLFGTDPIEDFEPEFQALKQQQLIDVRGNEIRLTTRGMFYADSVAGLLAWRRMLELRTRETIAQGSPMRELVSLVDVDSNAFNFM